MDENRRKKIVIHCASGIENSGDEAILKVLLNRYTPDFDVTVISLNARNTAVMFESMPVTVLGNSDHACAEAIRSCDVFILGGGGLLQDKTTIFNVLRWLSKLKMAIKLNKKTCIYANSIGELNYAYNRKKVGSTLKKVDLITLRDEMSKVLLHCLGVTEQVYVTADPVFSLPPPDEEYARRKVSLLNLPETYICICVRHWYDTHPLIPVKIATRLKIRNKKNIAMYMRYVETLAQTVDRINENLDLPVVFLSMCHGRDASVAEDILLRTKNAKKNVIVNEPSMQPETYLSVIMRSRALLGMRLHSLIYAGNVATPAVALIYQDKVLGLVEEAGLEHVHVDSMSVEELYTKLEEVLKDSEAKKQSIVAFHKSMKQRESQNISLFRALISKE